MLPHRNWQDIKKQLNCLSGSEERQACLKELLKKQKHLNAISLKNFDFNKEIHYKSPFEQADHVQLPSMYTLVIERLRLSNILQETKKLEKEHNKNQAETSVKSKKSKKLKITDVENNCELDIETDEAIKITDNVQDDSVVCEPSIIDQTLDTTINKTIDVEEVNMANFKLMIFKKNIFNC